MKNRISWLVLTLFSFATVTASAQEGADAVTDEAADQPQISPPELLEYVEAEYPPEAFAAGIEGVVVATIDIDESGLVTDVKIMEPAGHGFDEAALDAMLRFVFAPALKDGEPIPSQVIYRYTFFIKVDAPLPEQEAPPPLKAKLSGKVTGPDKAPVAGALVSLLFESTASSPEAIERADAGVAEDPGASSTVTTDESGRFSFEELDAGSYLVDVAAAGFMPFNMAEQLQPGESLEVIYSLDVEQAMYETVVRGRRPPREVTRREVTRREITRIPGTGGDALRSIQNLPGMARASLISGALIVRGSSPSDTSVYFDSMPLPLLYHFGGLTSVINSDLLERIDFYPGNYDVRYGGATGGIVDVYPRTPKTDRFHAYVDADFWDVGALAEGPLGDKWSVAAAARRSYIDGILNAAMPAEGGFEFTTAPRYWDYQAVADYHPSARDNLQLFVYGSDDRVVFVFGDEVLGNPNFTQGMDLSLGFHTLQAKWDHKFSKTISNQASAAFGFQSGEGYLGGNIEFKLDEFPLHLRDELTFDPGDNLVLRSGVDAVVGWSKYRFRAPEIFPREGAEWDPIGANTQYIEDEGQEWYYRPSWYGELELTVIPDLRLIYGLRSDYYPDIQKASLDPRFVARYEMFRGTTLKGGVGLFHQSPEPAQANEEYGNPDLERITAIHYGLGVEQKLIEVLEIDVEGFYKDLSNLVVPTDDMIEEDGELVPKLYSNEGRGFVYGMEFMVKHYPTDRFFGWITYTLMRSQRVDYPGEEPRLFDHDQTHILTVVASVVVGRGWEAGIRFRLVSGDPETPVIGSVYDSDSDIYFPVYGRVNSKRTPMFHQLDIRIDKNVTFFNTVKAAFYLDVQNVYNHQNVEGFNYNYDYSERNYFYGLPLVPSLGIKLEY